MQRIFILAKHKLSTLFRRSNDSNEAMSHFSSFSLLLEEGKIKTDKFCLYEYAFGWITAKKHIFFLSVFQKTFLQCQQHNILLQININKYEKKHKLFLLIMIPKNINKIV